MAPYVKVSSSRFQVDLQESHFSILISTSSRLRQVKPTPLDLRSSSRPKSTSWGGLPGLVSSQPSRRSLRSILCYFILAVEIGRCRIPKLQLDFIVGLLP